ncbi:DNA repair protein RAD4 [Citrus sinensis]|nr:DNA repair protein RAD4 [Citrus sinensis]
MRTRQDSKTQKDQASGTLAETSREGVGKFLRHVNARSSSRSKKQDCAVGLTTSVLKVSGKQEVDKRVTWSDVDAHGCSRDAMGNTLRELDEGRLQDNVLDGGEEMYDSDWEDGSIPVACSKENHPESDIKGVTIEFDAADSVTKKPVRRASAEDKELAELVHKVHLLCLLARGRLIDSVCDDPLIQASLLSLLPSYLLKISEVSKLTANALSPIVSWFHDNFHVRSSVSTRRSFHSALAHALESREGTPEEIAALSVALFRALKLTTRFVSILDVASLKPEADKNVSSNQDSSRVGGGIFNAPTLMVAKPEEVLASPVKSFSCDKKENVCETSSKGSPEYKYSSPKSNNTQSKKSPVSRELSSRNLDPSSSMACSDISEACHPKEKSQALKRKGDLEFEMQLEMALSATNVGTSKSNICSDVKDLNSNSSTVLPVKRLKKIESGESSTSCLGISTAVGSRKVGAPLYWAEVYCSGENLTGKWVHVDAANAIIDGEQKVEAAAAACKTSLRYIVAFAGCGAKDVTRRYCMKWYRIASKRVNSAWWDAVLAPLRELESGATGGMTQMEMRHVNASNTLEALKTSNYPYRDSFPNHVSLSGDSDLNVESSAKDSFVADRNSLEDMELETRALTEPLPTNQQAYKNHQLYVIERWLNKYQILYPKGPILGFCSGHAVYPRSCVQTLKTKERWLQEALQVKATEVPVKVIKNSSKSNRGQDFEPEDYDEVDARGNIELYGKWQLEPLRLPSAVNGIVPRNERGQVDVWSEKCLPPGTVHLRLPRVYSVAKRLEIDSAPAMVGFEFRNGRSTPVFDGIVVCVEFKDTILEAYAEEEEKREAEEKKRREAQATSRWYQLLSSIVTRQRLNNCYGNNSTSQSSSNFQNVKKTNSNVGVDSSQNDWQSPNQIDKGDTKLHAPSPAQSEEHEHVYLIEDQSFDEENSVTTKRCHCGFTIQVEEL